MFIDTREQNKHVIETFSMSEGVGPRWGVGWGVGWGGVGRGLEGLPIFWDSGIAAGVCI